MLVRDLINALSVMDGDTEVLMVSTEAMQVFRVSQIAFESNYDAVVIRDQSTNHLSIQTEWDSSNLKAV